jgi:hypothetical protein
MGGGGQNTDHSFSKYSSKQRIKYPIVQGNGKFSEEGKQNLCNYRTNPPAHGELIRKVIFKELEK